MTESFGPVAICDPQPDWPGLSADEVAARKARQGVANVIAGGMRIVDADGRDLPADGESMGEVLVRGNDVMLGYYEDEEATRAACLDGWLRSGDVGVIHPDGYLELKDRAKDVIISGGENISSVEVEQALASHPSVLEVAVVGLPDQRWGERPAAWVVLRGEARPTEEELRDHVRARLARFKTPDRFIFVESLPKTGTGKVRKVELRQSDLAAGS
jgi:fatty-acyl-CoA synthase